MEEKYFITDDTALAAYLFMLGYTFVEATLWGYDSNRKKYIIHDKPSRLNDEEDFYLRRTTVAPMDYHDARVHVSRFLKREIRDPRFENL
jgi:hypothetical protein